MEGGSANDYDYANGDPINNFDLDGLYCVTGKNKNGSCRSIARGVQRLARSELNSRNGTTALGLELARRLGARCGSRGDLIECTGAYIPTGAPAFTVGDVVISKNRLGDDLWRHESRHANQYAVLGPALIPFWVADQWLNDGCGVLEGSAGFKSGGYNRCVR